MCMYSYIHMYTYTHMLLNQENATIVLANFGATTVDIGIEEGSGSSNLLMTAAKNARASRKNTRIQLGVLNIRNCESFENLKMMMHVSHGSFHLY